MSVRLFNPENRFVVLADQNHNRGFGLVSRVVICSSALFILYAEVVFTAMPDSHNNDYVFV